MLKFKRLKNISVVTFSLSFILLSIIGMPQSGVVLSSVSVNNENLTQNDNDEFGLEITNQASSYNYAEALQKSIYFYMQQRSGDLSDSNPVIWRGDSGMNDGVDVGLDLTGGYYDAGDHIKFNLPMASTIMTLGLGVYEYKEAYADVGLLYEIYDTIKWGTDYFMKCHPEPNVYYYQVGDGSADHAWWGSVEVIEEVMERPAYKVDLTSPGSCVVGGTAAALAISSIIFEHSNPDYASECFTHA